jgi:hypothetical protein
VRVAELLRRLRFRAAVPVLITPALAWANDGLGFIALSSEIHIE